MFNCLNFIYIIAEIKRSIFEKLAYIMLLTTTIFKILKIIIVVNNIIIAVEVNNYFQNWFLANMSSKKDNFLWIF